jgi:hypothetical protein
MKPVNIVIVEDKELYSNAIRKVFEDQRMFPCNVIVLNPDRDPAPTLKEFVKEIREACGKSWNYLVLMDNCLGKWECTGAQLTQFFDRQLMSITTGESIQGASFHFREKMEIAYLDDGLAKKKLLETAVSMLRRFMPSDWADEIKSPVAAS